MHTLTSDQARVMASKRKGNNRPKPRTQILRMQASLLVGATDATIPLHIRAAAARAWDVLEERLRIIDGKPLPGHLKPERASRRELNRKAMLSIAQSDLPSTPAG